MKFIGILILSLAITATSFAQASFWLDHSEASVAAPSDSFITLTVLIFTNSTSDFDLKWKMLENNLVPGWDASVCDNITCHIGIPDSGYFAPITDEYEGFLKLNVYLEETIGQGTISFLVYDANDPSNADTAIFSMESIPLSLARFTPLSGVIISPVPANDFINVQLPGKIYTADVYIYSIEGKMLLKENGIQTHKSLNIGHLQQGIYLIKVVSGGEVYTRKFIRQ